MALLEEPSVPPLPGTFASTSPAVANMLRRWNYKEGSGLGPRGQGIVAPVLPTIQQLHCPGAGIGYGEWSYDNGLPDKTSPVAQDRQEYAERQRKWEELSRAHELEYECCDKILALLRDMAERDGSAETADALAAIVESKKVFKGKHTPGMWKAALPSSATRYIVEEVIKPGMAAEAREWKPAWDPDCYHWLRPWMPLVGHLPETLYDIVESKVITRADKFDYINIVFHLKGYMNPKQWDTFARQHVLPMLARLVRELIITPPKQVDTSFRTVMCWAPLLHVHDVVSILEEELFFDRYQHSLRHWMSAAKPFLKEAVAWCIGWKNQFTPELLAQERVLARLDAVVALVDGEAYVGGTQQESFLVDCMRRLQFV